MAPFSSTTAAFDCMQEIQDECWRLGIPFKTRHREVAPNYFDFAPFNGNDTTQINQNIMVMQCRSSRKSPPSTDSLPCSKKRPSTMPMEITITGPLPPAMMTTFWHLMSSLSIASHGNDFRLGACEAPPAIVSSYLGESMTEHLEALMPGTPLTWMQDCSLPGAG
jgi:glutamine synthetase